MRALIPALAALALAACGTTASPPAETSGPLADTVRVMSFNVRVDVAADGDDAWPHRRDAVAALVRTADVVGVQEATPAMLADLDARLPGFARVGMGRDADGGGEQSAVLYRRSRFAPLDNGTFWLSETPDEPGSVGWDAALPRIATWARFEDRESGRAFVVVNTHFDHRGAEARRQSARLLAARALEIAGDLPLVVTGDVNATDDSDVYRTLTRDLRDTRLVSESPPAGPAGTWNGFAETVDRRIDVVLVGGPVRVVRAATLDRTVGDVLGTDAPGFVSDHHAVAATLAF